MPVYYRMNLNEFRIYPPTAALAFVFAAVSLFGCQPKIASPKNPATMVTVTQAALESEQIARDKEREAMAADARFKAAVKRIEAEAEIDLAELQASHDEALNRLQADATAVRQMTQAAIKDAEERQSAWLSGANAVSSVAASSGIPLVATLGGLATGIFGLVSASRNKRIATDATQTAEAESEARKNQELIAARIVDSLDVLKALSPEVANAIKQHGKTLAEWQGPEAVSFVNKVQQS
jgi:hypothetical protein